VEKWVDAVCRGRAVRAGGWDLGDQGEVRHFQRAMGTRKIRVPVELVYVHNGH
jgi:hypothetical protein